MKRMIPMVCAALAALALPLTATATNTVLSGVFNGAEQSVAALPGTCTGAPALKYQRVNNVQVTASGGYVVADAYNFNGADVTALIYSGNFNPNAPQNNLLTPDGVDIAEFVNLNSGTNYVVVVQHWCQNEEGAWAITFSGPGGVNSGVTVAPPDFTEGVFENDDPTTASDCGESQYQVAGPVQVERTGTYFYSDMSINYEVDMCLQVYSAPFNAGNPNANRVGNPMDDFGAVELQAGQNYYLVAQPLNDPQPGEYFYVFAPPAPFRITHAMAGGWFDPPTSGQGFVMDVFDNVNQMFVAWFTYDLERPAASADAMIGDPGHRWLTAQGPFDGDTGELLIYWTSGGVFDSANPAPAPAVQDGTLTVEFFDCLSGQVTYDLGSVNVSGQLPIQRLANDAAELCENLISGPGQPGPL
jgi:hypothetical protein